MTLVTQPLRDEHKELLPLLNLVKTAADTVEHGVNTGKTLDGAYKFLSEHLLPHAGAEEAALYPVIEKIMGSAEATKTMQADHAEIGRLTEELGNLISQLAGKTPTSAQAQELRALLYGLYALVKLHFAKEETVYLPLLDRHLAPQEATGMFKAMEAAAARAKQ